MEIEKKYLIKDADATYTTPAFLEVFASIEELVREVAQKGLAIRQGYLPLNTAALLCEKIELDLSFQPTEARIREIGDNYTFTFKGQGDFIRNEEEVNITKELFEAYWPETEGQRVEKIRLTKMYKSFLAEFDVYINRLLIVAEIEFPSPEAANISPLGKDITSDKNYKNINLAQ